MRRSVTVIALLIGFPVGALVGRLLYSAMTSSAKLPPKAAVVVEPSPPVPHPATKPPEPRRPKAVSADDTGKDWLAKPRTDLERRLESTGDEVRHAAIDEVMTNHAGDVAFLPALIRSWRAGLQSRSFDMTEICYWQSVPVLAMSEWAFPFLLETLRHPRDAEFAVRTFQLLGARALKAIPGLCHFAESDDARLRFDALRVLSHGNLALRLASRIEFFKPMLSDPDPWVVIHAADILGRIGALEPLKGHADVLVSTRAGGKIFNFNYWRKDAGPK